MEKNKNSKRKIIAMTGIVIGLMVITLSVSYSFFSYRRSSESSSLIAGDIYMHYKGQNTGINIDNAVPSESYDPDSYFEFTIEGKNTYTEKDIWYEIDLVYGDEPEGRNNRIKDDLLKFTLFEKVGEDGEERKVLDGVSYQYINNKRIWVNKIDKNTTEETKITYKLYMWISNDTVIGDNGNYTTTEWNENVFASVKVNVKGDFNEKTLEPLLSTNMVERLKALAYRNEKEIIAIDVTDKSNIKKCASVEACKGKKVEYRYSGPEVNNYIYLTSNTNVKEKWRIIGIFNDDEVGEYIKVVRDEVLPETYLPATFKASDGNTYKIQSTIIKDYVYWNNFTGTESDKNNWSTAGLQYWLNAEEKDTEGNNNYLSYLSGNVRDQLVKVKHYLGTMTYTEDNPKTSYQRERDVESCAGEKGTSSNTSAEAIASSIGCQVWAGNDATWTGKVSLMYPSDYGLSAIDTNWDKKYYDETSESFYQADIKATTWMYSTINDAKSKQSWMISPSSISASIVAGLSASGFVYSNDVYYSSYGIRPVLNISSQATYIKGNGTKENPYVIIAD